MNKNDHFELSYIDENISSDNLINSENIIKGAVFDFNNNYTGEIREIDINSVQSPPCLGGCGVSKIECYLKFKNCQNWICMDGYDCINMNCPAHYIRTQKGIIPNCQNCGKRLILQK